MFLTAEVLSQLGFRRLSTRGIPMPNWVRGVLAVGGIGLCAVPVFVGGAVSNLALWVGTFALLDPLNYACGRPSILRDWQHGRWGRTLALGAGGLWCGLLWEFWNYWALTKWQYHLPFLGAAEHLKYFEMPLPGLVGFIAFGIQVWVMWQTSLLVFGSVVEGEGQSVEDQRLRDEGCF
jgi:hypothetical protein